MKHSLYTIEKNDNGEGRAVLHLHPGQAKSWDSIRRFIFVIAGTQSGKTEYAPWWLHREILKQGDGDYLVVSPSYPLQSKKVTPAYTNVFQRVLKIGEYHKSDRILEVNTGKIKANIFFGSADNPDSLESATAKAAHLDEVGQKSFKLESWEAVQRRLAIHSGRVLCTTTPYAINWLKTEVFDRWAAGDEDYDVIQFASTMNPAFPLAEFERAERTLPRWKFDMFYRGIFTRPAGMIYDCLKDNHKVPYFRPHENARKFRGIDFGGINHMTVWVFEQLVDDARKSIYFAYREMTNANLTAKEHISKWREEENGEKINITAGGAKSEGQWRLEYQRAGVTFIPPKFESIEMGINVLYSLIKTDRFFVMDNCSHTWEQLNSYSRVLDERGEPTEEIEDQHSFHWADAVRYIAPHLKVSSGGVGGDTAERT